LNELQPSELAAVLTCLITEEDRSQFPPRVRVSPQVELVLDEIDKIGRKVWRLQRDFEVEVPVEFGVSLAGITEMWAQGANWDDIRNVTTNDEGDIVRSLRRTLDLCRQYMRAPGMPDKLVKLCQDTEVLIARDEVKEVF
jgi:superfamily II RNA helicase